MQPGGVLEIRVYDPETVLDLLTVLDRSGEKMVARLRKVPNALPEIIRRQREGFFTTSRSEVPVYSTDHSSEGGC
jgi:hypothetical protein